MGMGMPMMIHSDTPAAQQSVWSHIMRVLLFKRGVGCRHSTSVLVMQLLLIA